MNLSRVAFNAAAVWSALLWFSAVQAQPAWPARAVRVLIPYAPGGGVDTVSRALFGKLTMSGAHWTHVPFKGAAPASIGVMSGEVDFSFGSTLALAQLAKTGKVRALGVTGDKRFAPLPEVPTIAESGIPGYLAVGWYGFYGPANMPAELVRKIHADTTRASASADVKEQLERVGNEMVMSSPEDFAAFLKLEVEKWGRVVKAAKLRVE
jgi:tripartite-type tricarboxylate transporter receptor subunit TctC